MLKSFETYIDIIMILGTCLKISLNLDLNPTQIEIGLGKINLNLIWILKMFIQICSSDPTCPSCTSISCQLIIIWFFFYLWKLAILDDLDYKEI